MDFEKISEHLDVILETNNA